MCINHSERKRKKIATVSHKLSHRTNGLIGVGLGVSNFAILLDLDFVETPSDDLAAN